MTPKWPLTPLLLRSYVRLYPRIILSKSHENMSKYVDTVTFFFNNLNQRQGCKWPNMIGPENMRSVASTSSGVSPLMAGGPGARLRAPAGSRGRAPGGGPGGSAPGSSRILSILKPFWMLFLAQLEHCRQAPRGVIVLFTLTCFTINWEISIYNRS